MVAAPKQSWTAADYLDFERNSAEKHEFIDGEVYDMAGAGENHNLVSGNIFASLHGQLSDRPCRVYMADMRVRVSEQNYFYPDVVALCDAAGAQFEGERRDTLLNPTVIIEVLSPSTEAFDRGKKFERYRAIPSFQEYLLIAQDRVYVEHYIRVNPGEWTLKIFDTPDAVIDLPAIGAALHLANVYARVQLDSDPAE